MGVCLSGTGPETSQPWKHTLGLNRILSTLSQRCMLTVQSMTANMHSAEHPPKWMPCMASTQNTSPPYVGLLMMLDIVPNHMGFIPFWEMVPFNDPNYFHGCSQCLSSPPCAYDPFNLNQVGTLASHLLHTCFAVG